MRFLPIVLLAALAAGPVSAQAPGAGAPSLAAQLSFQNAYFRGAFARLTSLPAVAEVRRLGTTGLVQEFPDAARTRAAQGGAFTTVYALVKADANAPPVGCVPQEDGSCEGGVLDVVQVYADVYAYYETITAATAGYPVNDTQACPAVNGTSPCNWQIFNRNYALFVYAQNTLNGRQFSVKDPFYAKWVAAGGISFGAANDTERSVTGLSSITATAQTFTTAAIYRITSGAQNGQIFAVGPVIYAAYQQNLAHGGFLGLPIADEVTLADGRRRQAFQGGSIEYTPGNTGTVRLPVSAVTVPPRFAAGLRLNLGESIEVSVSVIDSQGLESADRPVSWTTSNSRVVTVQGNGARAVLRAVGGGSATVTAASEGKVSAPIAVLVAAPCCAIGEGAPTVTISQAFQDAVTRNRIALRLPGPDPVRRAGNGYVQSFTTEAGVRLVLAKPDRISTAFVVTGEILRAWEQAGGAAGPLGYPGADATPGGRQAFDNGALAGNPVRTVSGAILAKWGVLNFEAGAAGLPAGDVTGFLTFTAAAGLAQAFQNGAIYAATSGTRAGQAFFSGGLILRRYLELGGPGGALGLPASDEFAIQGIRRQNFEGGYIEFAPGDTAARETLSERRPTITAAPSAVVAGSRLRLAVSGFPDNSTLRVNVAGRPEFTVATANGAYSWEVFVPLNQAAGVVAIRAEQVGGAASATGAFNVRGPVDARLQLTRTQGDTQTGLPGAVLPQTLRVALRDGAGLPVTGATVVFRASPGAAVTPASAVTDETGQASATLRLPAAEGVALMTAEAAGLVTTFSARATPGSLTNFPRYTQLNERGALIAAAASMLRYYQVSGELPSTGGIADPAAVGAYLRNVCTPDASANLVCDGIYRTANAEVANLWRLAGFVGGGLEVAVERPDAGVVRDWLGARQPVLLSLALTVDGAPAGGHFVAASGVGADGGVLITDPDPGFARTQLQEYLAGFQAGGRAVRATLVGAARLVPRPAASSGFVLAAVSLAREALAGFTLEAISPLGSCGPVLDLYDEEGTGVTRMAGCDGSQPQYQAAVGGEDAWAIRFTDLAQGVATQEVAGERARVFRIARSPVNWSLTPQQTSLTAGGVVNAASFAPAISPGAIAAVFGAGLGAGTATSVQVGGIDAIVVGRSAFQLNIQVPPALQPGIHLMQVRSAFGEAEQNIELRAVSPAIFLLGPGLGAAVNPDGRINSATAPIRRGQALVTYGTGLGATAAAGPLQAATTPLRVVLGGRELTPQYAGLTPGVPGLYQVNLLLPADFPPGLDLPMVWRQGGVEGNPVVVSVE